MLFVHKALRAWTRKNNYGGNFSELSKGAVREITRRRQELTGQFTIRRFAICWTFRYLGDIYFFGECELSRLNKLRNVGLRNVVFMNGRKTDQTKAGELFHQMIWSVDWTVRRLVVKRRFVKRSLIKEAEKWPSVTRTFGQVTVEKNSRTNTSILEPSHLGM